MKTSCSHCSNGATCIQSSTSTETESYKCQCATGWRGRHCEQDVNECATQTATCPAGATCHNLPGSYRCKCGASEIFTQGRCMPAVTCLDQPCLNGGICYNIPEHHHHRYKCECSLGFKGLDCETALPGCDQPRLCGRNGVCVVTSDGAICECRSPYFGARCTDILGAQESRPTSNLNETRDTVLLDFITAPENHTLLIGCSVILSIIVLGSVIICVIVRGASARRSGKNELTQSGNSVRYQNLPRDLPTVKSKNAISKGHAAHLHAKIAKAEEATRTEIRAVRSFQR